MKIVFRLHAVERMFERRINEADVARIIKDGKIIEAYPNDKPYPSYLALGYEEGTEQPIHVVYAVHADERIVITVYRPDPAKWNESFDKRVE